MKIKYFGSACVLVEHNGYRVLCDPWFTDGAYYGAWYQYPKQEPNMDEFKDLDFVYISHVHPDHFDVEFLKKLDRKTGIIILEYEEKFLRRQIEAIGFERIVELPNRTTFSIGHEFNVELWAADCADAEMFGKIHGCKPPKDYIRTLQIDSLAVFSGGGRVVVNLNDVPFGLAQVPVQLIRRQYKHIDVALISYAGAGPFPQAYRMTDEEKRNVAPGIGAGYLSSTTYPLLKLLDPDVYIPFAGGYIIGGKNWRLNEFKGVYELDDLEQALAPMVRNTGLHGEMIILDRGGSYDVSRGGITGRFKGTEFAGRALYTSEILSTKKYDFEDDPEPGPLLDKVIAAHKTLLRKQGRFDYYSNWSVIADVGDELFSIRFDTTPPKMVNKPCGEKYLWAQIDKRLFNRILDRKANWNNAEVGSHLILAPAVPGGVPAYEPMVHFLMAYFQCQKT